MAHAIGAGSVVRVFVADHHAIVREGLRAVLTPACGCAVVGEAATLAKALWGIAVGRPHVAVIDPGLPGADGLGAVRAVRSRYPRARCVVFGSLPPEVEPGEVKMAGAAGHLPKHAATSDLLRAVRTVAAGGTFFDPVGMRVAPGAQPPCRTALPRDLTAQERRILALIVRGHTNKEIAARLHLAEKTVRNYVSSILGKFGMKNRTQVASYMAGLASDDLGLRAG